MRNEPTTTLARTLTLPLLTLYGLGTMVGAGIYVLIGEIAGDAGVYAPFSFLVAASIAALTGMSYAELSARYPQSAGEAVYVRHAFNRAQLATLTGLAVVATGVVSAATIANGFVGYLAVFMDAPAWLVICVFVVVLGVVAGWGIWQSVWLAVSITGLSVIGLLLVVGVVVTDLPEQIPNLSPPMTLPVWTGITLGAFVAFYAFIGFEDMVNVAEEVKEPRRNLPVGIVLALLLATALYTLVAVVAVIALPADQLADSEAPLVAVVQSKGLSGNLIAVLSLLSVTNSALAQIIMAARILYGLGGSHSIPAVFARVNDRTRTPLAATAIVVAVVLVFALWLPLTTLARMTSFVIILVFAVINASLVRIKLTHPPLRGHFSPPIVVPLAGAVLCVFFLLVEIWSKLSPTS